MTTEYLNTEVEKAKHSTLKAGLEEIAQGDQALFNLLWSSFQFFHVLDDLVDELKITGERKEQIAKAALDFVEDLLINPHAQRWNRELRVLYASVVGRWLDGDAMAGSREPYQRLLAPAVRCGDVDWLVSLAHLARGWEGLRALGKLRAYDLPDAATKEADHV